MSSTQEAGEIFGAGRGPAQAMLRSPSVLIVSVGLWGMNVFLFRLFGINYQYVLNYDLQAEKEGANRAEDSRQMVRMNSISGSANNTDDDDSDEDFYVAEPTPIQEQRSGAAITWEKLVIFSISLLVILHYTTHYWMDHLGRSSIGAVFTFYGVVLVYIFLPFSSNRWLRKSFVIVLQRTFELVNPRCSCISQDPAGPRAIPFIDVFYADAMCSMSKVFFDWGMLFHMALHYPNPVPAELHNILIPAACAALPYLIRARQCLIMHSVGRIKNDPKRYQHIANAIKYASSVFPLCLSAYQKTVAPQIAKDLEPSLLLLLTINALYALYWDVVMDWGMMQNPSVVVQAACIGGKPPSADGQTPPGKCHHVLLRPRLRFGLAISSLIVFTDAILRFSWMLRFLPWFPNHDSYVLCTQFLEVFRRAIWNLLRVEWENIKQKARLRKVRDSFSDNEVDDETEAFLGPQLQMVPASNGKMIPASSGKMPASSGKIPASSGKVSTA